MRLAIIDFNRTIYDPESGSAVSGAPELLHALHGAGYVLALVSKPEAHREDTLKDLGLSDLFSAMYFVADKTPELFDEIARRFDAEADEVLVIGDHPNEEIRSGNLAGMRTIRLRMGKFRDLMPTHEHDPWMTAGSLEEIRDALGI
jgi:phosphoglycolate phosphatase-like HAD superfamily hydrolase